MDRIAADSVEFDGGTAAVDRAFELAMAEGVGRGSRVLSAFCARYARRTVEQAALAASGHRSVTGMPLLMVHEVALGGPVLGDYSMQVVELCGAVFHALDAGSVVAGHPDQCALVHHSLLGLLYDGVAITEAMVADRGSAIARAFTAQAEEALAALGTAPNNLTVREAELYHDLKDIVKWNDHDARLSIHVGHGLPSELVFSSRPWEAMRLVVVACVGPGHSVRVYSSRASTSARERRAVGRRGCSSTRTTLSLCASRARRSSASRAPRSFSTRFRASASALSPCRLDRGVQW